MGLVVLLIFWGMNVPYLWINVVGGLVVLLLAVVWEFWKGRVSSPNS